jgi:hypothetical protein
VTKLLTYGNFSPLVLKSITTIGITFQKPLDELVSSAEAVFNQPLEAFEDEAKILVSVMVLENVQAVLTFKGSVGEEKKAKCDTLFKGLTKALLKGMKSSKDNIIDPTLTIRALTSTISTLAHQDHEGKKLKKWSTHLNKYISYCLTALEDEISLKFLQVVVTNFNVLQERLPGRVFGTIPFRIAQPRIAGSIPIPYIFTRVVTSCNAGLQFALLLLLFFFFFFLLLGSH